MQDFRKLDVWHRAHALSLEIRRLTRGFPRSGYGSLKSQIIRAAESVSGTIVEGCGAATRKEFARYLDMSIKSNSELEYHLQNSKDCGVISTRDWRIHTAETVEVRRMLCGLRRKVLDADQSDSGND